MKANITVLLCALGTITLTGCGGGGGGGDDRGTDDVRFQGTVTRTSASTTTTAAALTAAVGTKACVPSVQHVEVCALGSCSTTSSAGAWSFATDALEDDDVNFSLTACDFDAKADVSDIDPDATTVDIAFAISPTNTVTTTRISEFDEEGNLIRNRGEVTSTTTTTLSSTSG